MENGVRRRLSQTLGQIKKGYAVDTFEGGFPVAQVFDTVAAADDNYFLNAEAMTVSGHTVTSGSLLKRTTDVYRALSVKGNQGTVSGTVGVYGTNWADREQYDEITLNGSNNVAGNRPFKRVDSVVLPARGAAGDAVSVGFSDRLGLFRPLLDNDTDNFDFLERAATVSSGVTAMILESSAPTVRAGADYATFEPNGGVVAADKFRCHFLTDIF